MKCVLIHIFNFSPWTTSQLFMQIQRKCWLKLWGLSVGILDAELYKCRGKTELNVKLNEVFTTSTELGAM